MTGARDDRPGTPRVIPSSDGPWVTLRRTRVRPTRRAVLHAVLGLLLYGAGANVNVGFVVVLAALLMGTVPFAAVNAHRTAGRVRVRRHLPGRVTAGLPVASMLEIAAATPAHLVATDRLTRTVGVAERVADGAELHAQASLPRGYIAGGEVEVIVSDVFGLVEARASGEVPASTHALPAIPDLRTTPADAPWAIEAGESVAREGAGPEILGVREYRHGDPVRTIHWRSSARRSKLVVRELADEALPGVRIDLAPGTWPKPAVDRAAELACGIAQDVQRGGYPTELGIDGAVVPWGTSARTHLALVPPHAGAEPRPLAPPPATRTRIVVTLAPAPDGVAITVAAAGSRRDYGTVPADLPIDALGGWFAYHGRER